MKNKLWLAPLAAFRGLMQSTSLSTHHARRAIRRGYAVSWQYLYKAQYLMSAWKIKRAGLVLVVLLLILLSLSVYLSQMIQVALEALFTTEEEIDGLRALLLNLGSTLIGAAAIVTSLVMFAMQVNIERMPYGLFRRLSTDSKLLGAFAGAFALAIVVAALSILTASSRLAVVILVAGWGIAFILIFFLYAYRRALTLINPLQQLGIVIEGARKELRAWARRAQRAAPLFESKVEQKDNPSPLDSTHDVARTVYFQLNAHWTNGAMRDVRHAMSFARRYAEQGDHEIADAALNVVVGINAAYVEAKGKTFYTNHLFVENPYASDGFINDTLEYLRQNVQAAIARRDEQQIEQTLQAIAALVQVYLGIDYSSPIASKSHAHIAAGYLSSSVQDIVPHNMADVLLEGMRLMGRSAQLILIKSQPTDIATLSEKIAVIACAGCAKVDYRPVTMVGMEQLANLTFDLLRSKDHNIRFAIKEIRQDIALVTKLFLNLPDTPLSSIHSTYLGPYYSSTSAQGFRVRLSELANALLSANQDNADAQSVIRNIECWADGLYATSKDILLEAVKAKSHFAFDMIYWITGVTEILLAVSNAPACDGHYQQKLRDHARWLISTLSWIPDDKDTVLFVENFQMTDILLEAAIYARKRNCEEIYMTIGDLLLSWTFRGGKYETGWGILEKGMSGLAALAADGGAAQISKLIANIKVQLSKGPALDQEIRDRAARDIRERAETLFRQAHTSSHIDRAIEVADHTALQPLLKNIANLLSPHTD